MKGRREVRMRVLKTLRVGPEAGGGVLVVYQTPIGSTASGVGPDGPVGAATAAGSGGLSLSRRQS